MSDLVLVKENLLTRLNNSDEPILLKEYKNLYHDSITDDISELIDYFKSNNKYEEFNEWFNLQPLNFNRLNILQGNQDEFFLELKTLFYVNLFLPVNIIYQFERSNLIAKKYINEYLTLFIYAVNDDDFNLISLDKIKFIFEYIKHLFNFNKKIKIRILLSSIKKELSGNILTPKNVNSGSSFNNEINLWRIDEFYKVFIHELIHTVNADRYILNNYAGLIEKKYQINGMIRPNEAYTEALTVLLMPHILNIVKTEEELNEYLNQQHEHFIHEWIKICHHLNINPTEFKNNTLHNKINQTTDVVSYFYFKMNLLRNYHKWKKYLVNYNFNDKYLHVLIEEMQHDENNYDDYKIDGSKLLRMTKNIKDMDL
jgi:hypothetical protein